MTTEDAVPEQNPAPSLQLTDVAKMTQLVALAIKRGAFEPNEIREVGDIYEKVSSFLQHQAEVQAALQTAEPTGEE